MSLIESNCSKRKCVHYLGLREFIEGEVTYTRHICLAFLSGIPGVIAYGDEKHLTPLKQQHNDFVYEKGD